MDINRVTQLMTTPATSASSVTTPAETASSFSQYLTDAMEEVNQSQLQSANLVEKYAAGQVQDVHQVMVASQKSTVLLQLTMQVRNKVIESYQDIMRMQI